jgi:predicted SAM-dependent methyltransferase
MLHSRARAALLVASNPGPLRLCLGSGSAPIADWLNLDLEGRPDLRWDLRKPLPFASASVDRIYSEHFIEHLDHRDGASLLRDCRRLLKADGVLRIATPDLPALVEAYRGDWQDQDWLRWPGHEWIDSAAKMLNQCFQGWGHKFLYDAKELEGALTEAGFTEIRRCKIGESSHAELSGLETRLDSLLIFEAWGLKGAKE